MGRPRRQHQAEDAAKAASEAARVLQQRSQVARQEHVEKVPESEPPENWEPPKRYAEQRTAMLEEIAASRQEKPAVEAQEEPKAEERPKEELKVETPPEKPQEAVEAATKTVKVKVDGEEFEAPEEEVEAYGGVRAYQTQKAAENRLKKQNEVLAEIRKMQSDLAEQLKVTQKPKEPEITDDQFIAERIDKIRFGTPEESAVALREILQKQQAKAIDPNQIIEQATGKIWHDQAVRQFDKDFQDIVTNPDLLELVVLKRNKKLAQLKGAPQDWNDFYRAVGNEVRGLVGKPTSSTTTQSTTSGTPSQQSTKEERKAAAATSIPASAARAELPKEEKPQTRADVLREMRQKRGLPVD